ncbi:MAG: VOC family protein [Gammaproteobacteria bacterium]|nr:VOC family protein [Gammaproteobacteria bacterium]MDD9894273.1 VOC family protein [Gammaproteobacteria bacterium]
MPEINGIAHIALTVTDLERSKPFYRELFKSLNMKVVLDNAYGFYGVGGRTGIVIHQCSEENRHQLFDQRRAGLHHFCFRARSRKDVDQIHEVALALGANIIHGPQQDGFAPGYYSVLFEDPDGIRLEASFIPGKGILEPGLDQIGRKDTTWRQQDS